MTLVLESPNDSKKKASLTKKAMAAKLAAAKSAQAKKDSLVRELEEDEGLIMGKGGGREEEVLELVLTSSTVFADVKCRSSHIYEGGDTYMGGVANPNIYVGVATKVSLLVIVMRLCALSNSSAGRIFWPHLLCGFHTRSPYLQNLFGRLGLVRLILRRLLAHLLHDGNECLRSRTCRD